MFMTCVELDRIHPSTRQALADCCDMHRNVMRLFATSKEPLSRKDEHVLYRVVSRQNAIYLYITSASAPDLTNADWLKADTCRQRDLQTLLAGFSDGQPLTFDLLTHPSKKVKKEGKNSTRVFLRTPEERAEWLMRQGTKYGFRVISFCEETAFDIRGKRSTGAIVFQAVRMFGQLQITDTRLFAAAYQDGIGPEKAYGLGMLLLGRG